MAGQSALSPEPHATLRPSPSSHLPKPEGHRNPDLQRGISPAKRRNTAGRPAAVPWPAAMVPLASSKSPQTKGIGSISRVVSGVNAPEYRWTSEILQGGDLTGELPAVVIVIRLIGEGQQLIPRKSVDQSWSHSPRSPIDEQAGTAARTAVFRIGPPHGSSGWHRLLHRSSLLQWTNCHRWFVHQCSSPQTFKRNVPATATEGCDVSNEHGCSNWGHRPNTHPIGPKEFDRQLCVDCIRLVAAPRSMWLTG